MFNRSIGHKKNPRGAILGNFIGASSSKIWKVAEDKDIHFHVCKDTTKI